MEKLPIYLRDEFICTYDILKLRECVSYITIPLEKRELTFDEDEYYNDEYGLHIIGDCYGISEIYIEVDGDKSYCGSLLGLWDYMSVEGRDYVLSSYRSSIESRLHYIDSIICERKDLIEVLSNIDIVKK